MSFDVDSEMMRLETALGRSFTAKLISMGNIHFPPSWRIVQQCPVCEIELGCVLHADAELSAHSLHRELFALYDTHRCQRSLVDVLERAPDGVLEALYERTEREAINMAERAQAIADPALRARAERESNRLLEWAEAIHRRMTAP